MREKHIVVIGADNNGGDVLARAMAAIAGAMDRDVTIVVCRPDGACRFDGKRRGPMRSSAELAAQYSRGRDGDDLPPLLLFDAASINGETRPVSGLLPWLARWGGEPQLLSLQEVVSSFFNETKAGLFWTGLVEVNGYEAEKLLAPRWREIMNTLQHQEQNDRSKKKDA